MPGFLVSNHKEKAELKNVRQELCVKGGFDADGVSFERNTLAKFLNDKILVNGDTLSAVTEGVILNLAKLLKENNCPDLKEFVKIRYREDKLFFKDFRGAFSGAVYDKKEGEIIAWTGQYGDNSVFYSFDNDGNFAIGSQVNYILDSIKANGGKLTLDKKAILDILTFGFMEDKGTYANEIKRLMPGEYLTVTLNEDKKVTDYKIGKYYILGEKWQSNSDMPYDEAIDKLNELFRKAIELEYEKDREYGYDHLTDLSGGLDSRINTMIGHELGYKNITNLAYSLAGYLDETTPVKISRDLGTLLMFSPLDDAGFMLDIDLLVSMNYGLVTYAQITGGERVLRSMNTARFGVEHTGQLGDVIFGSIIKVLDDTAHTGRAGFYSKFSLDALNEYPLPEYANKEMYMLTARGMLGALGSHIIRRNYIEAISPFLDVDVVEFCLSLPLKYRVGHKIYFDLLKKKYPEACKYVWETTGAKPGAVIPFAKQRKFFKRAFWFVVRRTGLNQWIKEKNMNPFEQWYKDSKLIQDTWNSYFEENINHPAITEELNDILTNQFRNGRIMEKMQVLTALAAVKYYF